MLVGLVLIRLVLVCLVLIGLVLALAAANAFVAGCVMTWAAWRLVPAAVAAAATAATRAVVMRHEPT